MKSMVISFLVLSNELGACKTCRVDRLRDSVIQSCLQRTRTELLMCDHYPSGFSIRMKLSTRLLYSFKSRLLRLNLRRNNIIELRTIPLNRSRRKSHPCYPSTRRSQSIKTATGARAPHCMESR